MLDRTRSVAVPHAFCIRSVSILYPFCSVLFPFWQCSIGECSWNPFRRTRFPRTRLQECIQWISNTRLKHSRVHAWIQTINVHLCGEISLVTWKIHEEDCNVTSRPVTESFSEMMYSKQPVIGDCPRKRSNELAKHFQHHQWRNASKRQLLALVVTQIL